MERIRVGVVGASPEGSWASTAHLPALARLEEFAVSAVATTRLASAERAAAAFGARHALADWRELVGHPEVDLVVVSVKVPDHAGVARAALAEGKHVYVEWPLAASLDAAAELTAAAVATGTVHAVGLQGYHSPSAAFVRELLAAGRVGRVESVSMIAPGDPLGGGRIWPGAAWSVDPAAGNTLLTVMVGHALSVLDQLGGPFADVSAVLVNRHPQVVVDGTGQPVASGAPTQVALHGRLAGGAVASLAVPGGAAPGPDGFLIVVAGTEGTLRITPTVPEQYVGWADWRVELRTAAGERATLPVPDRHRTVPPGVPAGPARNVAALYREVAAAITEGRPAHPGFHTALRHHRVLAAVERASVTGARQQLEPAAVVEGSGV